MKRFLAVFLVVCTLWCGNVFAANEYEIIDMSEFSAVGELSEGLCAVRDKAAERWGFVDVNKNWVIAPQFKNGLQQVYQKGKQRKYLKFCSFCSFLP